MVVSYSCRRGFSSGSCFVFVLFCFVVVVFVLFLFLVCFGVVFFFGFFFFGFVLFCFCLFLRRLIVLVNKKVKIGAISAPSQLIAAVSLCHMRPNRGVALTDR